eukprot:6492800-Amphidinium_carterae.1
MFNKGNIYTGDRIPNMCSSVKPAETFPHQLLHKTCCSQGVGPSCFKFFFLGHYKCGSLVIVFLVESLWMFSDPEDWGAVAAYVEESACLGEEEPLDTSWADVSAITVQAAPAASGTDTSATPLFASAERVGEKRGRPISRLSRLVNLYESHHGPFLVNLADDGSGHCAAATASSTLSARPAVQAISLRVDGLDLRVHEPNRGRMAIPNLFAKFLALEARGSAADVGDLDAVVLAMARYYLEAGQFHIASKAIMAEMFEIDSGLLQTRMNRLACYLYLRQYYVRRLYENKFTVALHSSSLLLCIEHAMYDETPLKLTALDTFQQSCGTGLGQMAMAADAPGVVVDTCKGQALLCKMLQSHNAVTYVLQLSGSLVALTMTFPTILQNLRSNSGQVLAHAISQHSGTSFDAELFATKVRTVALDAAPANIKGEDVLAEVRPSWLRCLFFCDIHSIASAHGKCFEALHPQLISGLISYGLVMRLQSSWVQFKRCVLKQIDTMRLNVVVASTQPPEVQAEKLQVLSMFFGRAADGLPSCVALLRAFTGNWKNHEALEFAWPHGAGPAPDDSAIRQLMKSALSSTLLSKKPHLYPRHRWTGFMKSCSDAAMLFMIHGLMQKAVAMFMQRRTAGHKQQSSMVTAMDMDGEDVTGYHLHIEADDKNEEGVVAALALQDEPADAADQTL